MKRIFLILLALLALYSCAQSPEPETIVDQDNCSENDRFKEDCQ